MPASVMATTVTLATTINRGVPTVSNTPPVTTTTAHPDYTIKDTGRSTTAHQSFVTNNQHQGRQ